jgi:hypothetical protein
MIPYDDLVVALQTWRARQGLPVAQMSGIMVPPPAVVTAPAPAPRTNPPAPPKAAVPPPLAPVETRDEDVDAALLEEAHYENEGDDFAMAFGAAVNESEESDESTSIGTPPPPGQARDSFGGSTEPEPGSGKHNRNEDW